MATVGRSPTINCSAPCLMGARMLSGGIHPLSPACLTHHVGPSGLDAAHLCAQLFFPLLALLRIATGVVLLLTEFRAAAVEAPLVRLQLERRDLNLLEADGVPFQHTGIGGRFRVGPAAGLALLGPLDGRRGPGARLPAGGRGQSRASSDRGRPATAPAPASCPAHWRRRGGSGSGRPQQHPVLRGPARRSGLRRNPPPGRGVWREAAFAGPGVQASDLDRRCPGGPLPGGRGRGQNGGGGERRLAWIPGLAVVVRPSRGVQSLPIPVREAILVRMPVTPYPRLVREPLPSWSGLSAPAFRYSRRIAAVRWQRLSLRPSSSESSAAN